MKSFLSLACLVGALTLPAQATVITFEDVAPDGGQVNGPSFTFGEFTFTNPTLAWSIFDSATSAPISFPGDTTDWLGFGTPATVSLAAGGATFDLYTITLGRSTVASTPTIDFTIIGTLAAGGTVSVTYTGLTGATTVSPNLLGVTNLAFVISSDAGIDDLVLSSPVPEPASMALLGAGLVGIAFAGRRRALATKS